MSTRFSPLSSLGNGISASEASCLSTSATTWEGDRLVWWPRVARVIMLVLTDLAALAVSVCVGYFLWARLVLDQSFYDYREILPLFLLFPLGYAGVGLYPGFGLGAVEVLRRLSSCTSFAFLILAAASFVMKLPAHYSRATFVITWVVSLIAVPLGRFFILSLARQWNWWKEPVVLVGSTDWGLSVLRTLEHARSLGYRPVGIFPHVVSDNDHAQEGGEVLSGQHWARHSAEKGVCVALVEEGQRDGMVPHWLQQYFQHIVIVGEYGDLPVERVQVRNLGGVIGVEFSNNLLNRRNRFIKRLLDIVLSVFLLSCTAPLIVIGGGLVKLWSKGPLFFSQVREGQDGHSFKVWKIRTMYHDAEKVLARYLATNPELRREWQERYKLRHDPRIIAGIGTLLRRFSVDELPQLWNVIKGDMSLVGPRPFPEYHLRQFSPEFRKLRCRVRPGLTGMWQVTVRSVGDLREQERHDGYYIRNWSIWLDLHILGRTAVAVVGRRGAY